MIISSLFPQRVKNLGYHLPEAIWANFCYGWPSRQMDLIGVTGTDGKTTTCWLIYHLLSLDGLKTGLVSTVAAKIGTSEETLPFHVTSPSPLKLQSFLRQMKNKNVAVAVLEVTSHALDQFRFWGCQFKIGVLTNITHEHLDYHHDYDRYLATKAKLLSASQNVVINRDDSSYCKVIKFLKGKKIITYGIKNEAQIMAKDIVETTKGSSFTLLIKDQSRWQEIRAQSPLWGEFNVYNQLAAIAAVIPMGIKPENAAGYLGSFAGVRGRLEKAPNRKGIHILIDFAHTPNGLKQALNAVKRGKPARKKLIVVFGCAGFRDREKRPMMGEIAARLADYAIFTSEDPRTENVNEIINQIAAGAKRAGWKRISRSRGYPDKRQGYFTINSRQEAINFAIRRLARRGDWVILCGKGHERSMCFGKTEYPWSEHEAVRIALKKRGKK